MRSVVFHAHFYQPPREEPWLEQIEREPSAAPSHDWNRRIEQECYRAVVAARIPAPDGRIARITNTLEAISFNIGPTLAEWLAHEAPDTWAAILVADRTSRARRGHGNAIAAPYHHVILPLASRRGKITEVRWGIADFRRRFGREPLGMWLPETAVDMETLDVVAGEGIRFTILAPHQVVQAPPAGLPGKITTASGRSIAVFIYDGPLAHDVAFGRLIKDAGAWTAEVLERPAAESGPTLIALAADGETFGHHHPFGEMALAATLDRLGRDPEVRLDNFASFLTRYPAEHPIELIEPSSWSCVHGVERWRSDCGCRIRPETSQAWRAPLREALEWLSGELHARFEAEGTPLLKDPWEVRNAWVPGAPSPLSVRARELLEMEMNLLRMFTSCAWFFDDLAGLESQVCLRYAARAIDWAGPEAVALHAEFRARLAQAIGNDPAEGTGSDLYDRVRPRLAPEVRATAAFAVAQAIAPDQPRREFGPYRIEPGPDGRLAVHHRRTGKAWHFLAAVDLPGALDLAVEVRESPEAAPVRVTLADLPEAERDEIRSAFRRVLRPQVLDTEETNRVADGLVDYRRAIADALVRRLPADPSVTNELDLDGIIRALDLLALEGRAVPFDARTRYARLLAHGPPELRKALRGLAERFGFAIATDQPEAAPSPPSDGPMLRSS
ncbi:MAG TPA: DUF3536 domain-containing protein [Gemmatimonadales bacterium]|nr:DUF3536 domain-containing protein [Gemmatimonadales bacterium]